MLGKAADKLTSGDDGRRKRKQFDGEKTVARLRERIIEARREYADSYGRRRFSRDDARLLWDALGELTSEDDEREFHNRVYNIRDPHSVVIDSEVYERFVYEPTIGYLILRDAIVPALARACTDAIAKRDDWYARAMAMHAEACA